MRYRSDEAALRSRCDDLEAEDQALSNELASVDAAVSRAVAREQADTAALEALGSGRKERLVRAVAGGAAFVLAFAIANTHPLFFMWFDHRPRLSSICMELSTTSSAPDACVVHVHGRANAGNCGASVRCRDKVVYEGTGACSRDRRVVYHGRNAASAAVISIPLGKAVVQRGGEVRRFTVPDDAAVKILNDDECSSTE